jgi:hypothetical protein
MLREHALFALALRRDPYFVSNETDWFVQNEQLLARLKTNRTAFLAALYAEMVHRGAMVAVISPGSFIPYVIVDLVVVYVV